MTRMLTRPVAAVAVAALVLLTPHPASAQTEGWQVDLAPLYFWAATTNGNLAINGTKNIPVYMSFDDAKDKLAGAFAFHGEVRRGQWGFLGDINFIRLSTDVNYTTPIINAPITGTIKLDQVLFNGKVTFEVKPGTRFHIVGGLRTMTMSPAVHFTGPVGGQLADLDVSATKVAGVVGFIYRPKLGDHVTLLTQADGGGGQVLTWSALAGIEFLIKPWIGLAAGYNVVGVDTGNVPKSGAAPVNDLQFDMTQAGPVFTLTFHWRN